MVKVASVKRRSAQGMPESTKWNSGCLISRLPSTEVQAPSFEIIERRSRISRYCSTVSRRSFVSFANSEVLSSQDVRGGHLIYQNTQRIGFSDG